jgi:hypothetical protein
MMRVLPLLPLLLVAACGGGDGTAISINANDSGGAFSAKASKDGEIAINAPGFSGNFSIPSIKLDAANFDINGVKLPEGSTISGMDVSGNQGSGGVNIRFTSPIAPAAARDWFQPKLAAEGFKLNLAGDGLTGTTDEGKPFKLTVAPSGDGASEGMITIGG